MLFSNNNPLENRKCRTNYKERRKTLSWRNLSKKLIITSNHTNSVTPKRYQKRASLYTSKQLTCSLTVEACMAVPLFFFAIISVIFVMETIKLQLEMQANLHELYKNMSREINMFTFDDLWKMEENLVELIGEENLDKSIIVDGSEGLNCTQSDFVLLSGVVNLDVSYKVEIPIFIFGNFGMTLENRIRGKTWNGYHSWAGSGKDERVYITSTGGVYHKSYHCSYLNPSIKTINSSKLLSVRNEDGGIYYPCEICNISEQKLGIVYITNTGSRFHHSLTCSGVKRTIHSIPLSEAVGRGVCSRCGAK